MTALGGWAGDYAAFWAERMDALTVLDHVEIARVIAEAQPRIERADFKTGSINQTTALALRALCRWVQPHTVVEVGTFIGVSTLSMRASWVYTCDVSNDCLPSGDYGGMRVVTHPGKTSTQMLPALVAYGAVGHLWFFDGLLTKADPVLIRSLSLPDSVYVFDDYNGEYKGVQNVRRLHPWFPEHVLIPAAGPVADTTLAVLVPESRL